MSKICKICGECDDSEFYVSGFTRCKTCVKTLQREREQRLSTDPQWLVAERTRHRIKSRKYRDAGRVTPNIRADKVDPIKRTANLELGKAVKRGDVIKKPCELCGETKAQGHHEDYSKPLDVTWLCVRHHNDRHIHLRDCETLGMTPETIEEFTSYG